MTREDSPGVEVAKLASLIKAYAPHDGIFELRIPGVYALRRSRTYMELAHGVQRSAVCIVAQGEKSVMVGREVYEYAPSRIIVFSVDVPVASQVTQASPAKPFLCLRLDLDPKEVAKLVLKVYPQGLPPSHESGGVYVGQADVNIISAAIRLIELMAQHGDAQLIAPLVVDEIPDPAAAQPDRCAVGSDRPRRFGCLRGRKGGLLVAFQFLPTHESRRAGHNGEHERFLFPPALQVGYLDEPRAVSKSAAASRGQAPDVVPNDGRGYRKPERGVCQRFAVQQGIRTLLRERAHQGHRQVA